MTRWLSALAFAVLFRPSWEFIETAFAMNEFNSDDSNSAPQPKRLRTGGKVSLTQLPSGLGALRPCYTEPYGPWATSEMPSGNAPSTRDPPESLIQSNAGSSSDTTGDRLPVPGDWDYSDHFINCPSPYLDRQVYEDDRLDSTTTTGAYPEACNSRLQDHKPPGSARDIASADVRSGLIDTPWRPRPPDGLPEDAEHQDVSMMESPQQNIPPSGLAQNTNVSRGPAPWTVQNIPSRCEVSIRALGGNEFQLVHLFMPSDICSQI